MQSFEFVPFVEMSEIARSAGDGNVSGVVLVKDCGAPKGCGWKNPRLASRMNVNVRMYSWRCLTKEGKDWNVLNEVEVRRRGNEKRQEAGPSRRMKTKMKMHPEEAKQGDFRNGSALS